jgi:FkbM family methyltransferase
VTEPASGPPGWFDRLRLYGGVLRSLRIYYGGVQRRRDMANIYASFVKPGDLAFDLGAHVGDRVAAFRALGCRVVAIEPQPPLARLLQWLYGWRRGVTVVQAAVGAQPGTLALRLNLANPTVATGSSAFVAAARDAEGWRDQAWTRTVEVPQITLDGLIAAHGHPDFIKIDVEGFEAEVLAGLSSAVPALSFEFTIIQRDIAQQALARLAALGPYRFNAALGESQRFVFDEWMSVEDIGGWLDALPNDANSGDIYATLEPSA